MATKMQQEGKRGEDAACKFLREKGCRILFRNFGCRFGEIDIIALKDSFLIFAEVKTRRSARFALPCEAVDFKKRARLRRTANFFLLGHKEYHRFSPRMDVLEVYHFKDGFYINHIENAFGDD